MSKTKNAKKSDSGFELLDLDLGDFKPSKKSPAGKKKKKKETLDDGGLAMLDLFLMEDPVTKAQSDDSGLGSIPADQEDSHLTDNEQETAVQGEFAIDMFIDPTNPFNKTVHSSLKSTIEKQKKRQEEVTKLRAEQLRDQGFGFLCTPTPLTQYFLQFFTIKRF